ncbi:HNH endonuclease signature motif containing protein [Brevibacterium daeguense]|uniref:HNH endonuclease signature motif containing protein n=1 Tax=Brevibacterium daeguense TaxID=909936 RepID=UPI001F32BB5F
MTALQAFMPGHDVVAVQRLRFLAEAVIEECFARHFDDLTPPKDEALSDWVAERLDGTHVTVIAAVLDTTIVKAYGHARVATVACYGLPKLFAAALKGEITYVRLEYAARRALHLTAKQLKELDDVLVKLRAGMQWQGFCRKVNDTIRLLDPPTVREAETHKRRRVEVWATDDCEGRLLLTGPLLPLKALHARLEATARAIRTHQTSTFGEQLEPGDEIVDERTMDQLMFDMLTTMTPTTRIRIQRGTGTGDAAGGAGGAGVAAGGPSWATAGADGAGASDPADAAAGGEWVEVACPSNGEWLRKQASVVVTVPALTLTRHADLPGLFADGSPIPAEMAREFVSHTNVMYRVLTDPAGGRIVDEVARSYTIPNALRMTLVQKRPWCPAPGCTRRAATCDQDHAIPYPHHNPKAGGRTDLHNLHPLCKRHHQLKTRGKLRLEHGPDGIIRWLLPHGIIHDDHPPDRPIDQAHADYFTGKRPHGVPPDRGSPPDGRRPDGGPPDNSGPPSPAEPPDDGEPPDDAVPSERGASSGSTRPPDNTGPPGTQSPGLPSWVSSGVGWGSPVNPDGDDLPNRADADSRPAGSRSAGWKPESTYEESPDVELPFEEPGPFGTDDRRLRPDHGQPPPF